MDENARDSREYCGVFRADSALVIEDEKAIVIGNIPTNDGPVTLSISTYYREVQSGQKAPHKLQLEVTGPASSLDQAKPLFLGSATAFSAMVSFLGNGYVDTPLPYVVYLVTGRYSSCCRPKRIRKREPSPKDRYSESYLGHNNGERPFFRHTSTKSSISATPTHMTLSAPPQ